MEVRVINTGSSSEGMQIVWNAEATRIRIPQKATKSEHKNEGLQLDHSFIILGH